MSKDFTVEHKLHVKAWRTFILGGRATFTVLSKKTGKHFTYKITSWNFTSNLKDPTIYLVRVLTGPDNSNDYTLIGTIQPNGKYIPKKQGEIHWSAPSNRGFAWLWHNLELDSERLNQCDMFHEGACCKCGRPLTDPTSIRLGIGPKCRGS